MNPAKVLAAALQAGGAEAVGALLRGRPDLAYPVPGDLVDLAARALSLGSTQRALASLDDEQLVILGELVSAAVDDVPVDDHPSGRLARMCDEFASLALLIGDPRTPTAAVQRLLGGRLADPEGDEPRRASTPASWLDEQTLDSVTAWLLGELSSEGWRATLAQATEEDRWVRLAHAREDGTLAVDLVRVLLVAHGTAYLVRRAGRRLNLPLNRVVAAQLLEPVVINDHLGG